ncbi:MAG: hypothetical protein R2843_12960 [Thermomicrobiales bacterium]
MTSAVIASNARLKNLQSEQGGQYVVEAGYRGWNPARQKPRRTVEELDIDQECRKREGIGAECFERNDVRILVIVIGELQLDHVVEDIERADGIEADIDDRRSKHERNQAQFRRHAQDRHRSDQPDRERVHQPQQHEQREGAAHDR